MRREPGHVWRKKREGREYGSYHTYAGRRIVNLGTAIADEARAAAAKLTGAPSAPSPVGQAAGGSGGAPTSPRPAFVAAWAAGGAQAPPPGPLPPAAPPAPPVVTPAMIGLADGMATAIARLNAVTISIACKYLAKVQPAKPDPDDVEALEKTWSTGLQQMMLLHGLQWWHILLAQNGALALSMIQGGTPIPTTTNAPVRIVPQPPT